MSDSAVHCQLHVPAQASVTVGESIILTCDGELGGTLKTEAQIYFPKEEDQYKLALLKVKSATDKSVEMVVTTYRTGEHKEVAATVTDGDIQFQTSPLSWAVTSVLKEPKAVPSMGPLGISYPLWFWLWWITGIVLALGSVFYIYYRRHRRKKLLEELEKYTTMLSPFNQFSKDARSNLRSVQQNQSGENARQLIKKIDNDFRLYLIRELKVPALQVGRHELLKEIKKYHRPLFDENAGEFRRVISELDKASRATEVTMRDCEDVLHLTRKMADRIYAKKRKAT